MELSNQKPSDSTASVSSSKPPSRSASLGAAEEIIEIDDITENLTKDGDWSFPTEIEFPITCKVAIRYFKMGSLAGDENSEKKIKINTNNIKVEVKLRKEDLVNKKSLEEAIIRESQLKENCKKENISNPKFDLFTTRTDSKENYKLTKMDLVIDRLGEFVSKKDIFLVEVMEQIIAFAPKSPTIKIVVNSKATEKPNRLNEKEVKELVNLLKDCSESTYNPVYDKISCGVCKCVIKTKMGHGAAKTLYNYFQEKHYKNCVEKKGVKRGRVVETDEDRAEKLVANKKRLLAAFAKTPPPKKKPADFDDEDFVDDEDLVLKDPTGEVADER